jgi:hypothetical protein
MRRTIGAVAGRALEAGSAPGKNSSPWNRPVIYWIPIWNDGGKPGFELNAGQFSFQQ